MKKITVLTLLFFLTAGMSLQAQSWLQGMDKDQTDNFFEIKKAFDDYWQDKTYEKGRGWKQYKRWEWFWSLRTYPSGEFPDARAILDEYQAYTEKHGGNSTQSIMADWKELGPVNVPKNELPYKSSGLGRINCIRFHPMDNNTIWVGAASGGAWKSEDLGKTWELSPFTDILSIGISDIAIAPTNPNIIYAATGDANGYQSSRGYTIGIIKSTDGGRTWGTTGVDQEISNKNLIYRLIVHPSNPDIVYAGTSFGFYKTTDGGENWERKDPNTFRDFEIKVDDPNTLFASVQLNYSSARLYLSTDGGENWEDVQTVSTTNRMALATTEADPNYVYAIASSAANNGFNSFLRSTDAGQSWNVMKSGSPNILGRSNNGTDVGGQGHYDLAIAVSPTDKNVVYTGGIHIWRTENGGSSWELINHWTGYRKPYVHADQHDLVFRPGTGHLFSSNDGGIYFSTNSGNSWTDISNGLGIQQYYRFGGSVTHGNIIFGGTQDNGVQLLESDEWSHVLGADGMECAVDPTSPDIVYAENYYGALYKSTNRGGNWKGILSQNNTGEQGAWVTPFVVDPNYPGTLYIGYVNIFKTNDYGKNWSKVSDFNTSDKMIALAVAPSDSRYVYAANRRSVYASTNGGYSWERIQVPAVPPTYIAVDPSNPERIWITYSGYSTSNKVYEFDGTDWTNLSSSLPNVPVNTIVYQKNAGDRIYVGTDIGVFYHDNESSEWLPFNEGLPNVVINELEIHYGTGKLRAATFGRGLWETAIIDCDIETPVMEADGDLEFCSGDSVTLSVAQDYAEYNWSDGSKSKSIVVKNRGSYTVTVYDDQGCMARSESVNVIVHTAPNLIIREKGKNPLCEGDTLELMAGLGYVKYEWSTGATTKSIFVTEAGTYTLTAETLEGCKNTTQVEVSVVPKPDKPIISRNGLLLESTPADTYKWYLNDKEIAGASERTLEASASGNYRVEVFNSDGCSSISDPVDVITGINDDVLNGSLVVMPNPNNGEFTIIAHMSNSGKMNLRLYNMFGITVYKLEEDVNSGRISRRIDPGNLSPGLYMLELKACAVFYSAKIIIR